MTLLTVRGTNGEAYERTVTAGSDGSGWSTSGGTLWSGRALGDRFADEEALAVTRGSDGYAQFQRGDRFQGLPPALTSDPDVVTRSDGTWILFGRNSSGSLIYYDARPGAYAVTTIPSKVY